MSRIAKPKIESPNYSHIPNAILDNLAAYEDSELKVILVMCRQTFGWHRQQATLSIKFLQNATGLSHQTVITATKALIDSGLVIKVAGAGKGGANVFGLVVLEPKEAGCSPSQAHLTALSSPLDTPSQAHLIPPLSSPLETNKEIEEKEILKEGGAPPAATAPKSPKSKPSEANSQIRQLSDLWCDLFTKQFGRKYVHAGAKDTQGVKAILASGLPMEELGQVFRDAWRQSNTRTHWACVNQSATLAKFGAALNTIMVELSRGDGGRRTVGQVRAPQEQLFPADCYDQPTTP